MTTSDPREALDQIKARADRATPGPWEACDSTVVGITGPGDCGGCSGILSPAHEPSCYWSQIAEAAPSDAVFIAHARTDIDRLAAALESVLAEHHKGYINVRYNRSRIAQCEECQVNWPCPTVRAIEAKLSEEES